MAETPNMDEVDELIASMETVPGAIVDSPRAVPFDRYAPNALQPGEPDKPSAAATAATEGETDGTKPTRLSTPPLTHRRSERSASSENDASSATGLLLPLVATANSEPPPSTASLLPPTSPRPKTPVAIATVEASVEPPCDLDALTALLQSESSTALTATTTTVHAEPVESASDRVSATESTSEKLSVATAPHLLASSQQSLSFVPRSSPDGTRRASLFQKQASLSLMANQPPTQSTQWEGEGDAGGEYSPRQLASPRSASRLSRQNMSPSRRRLTIGTHEISPHALERLGVNPDILKKEKGMKKLGISDVDIERFEEIRRYSGVPHSVQPVTKVEFMFGFTREQLLRVKAINRLGTSEEEVQDEYSRRISRLGVHDVPIAQN